VLTFCRRRTIDVEQDALVEVSAKKAADIRSVD
jgi:hypothetical protein